ncbi:MAG: hypothetical protein GX800_10295 [Clostridiaceae bacterium]|jgi:hypothetical protein|nr:hypothetical protein [Clostridiaceae bacterium]
MRNQDIRKEISESGLKLWQIASAVYSCNDGNFSRKLRQELPAEEKKRIRDAIVQLKKEGE